MSPVVQSCKNLIQAHLLHALPRVCLYSRTCALSESAPVSSAGLVPTCQFWNQSSLRWSSSGVLTQGLVDDAGGRAFLSCASSHLTAFTVTLGSAVTSRFTLNVVHPIDDAGQIAVCTEGSGAAPSPLRLCSEVPAPRGHPFLPCR